MSDIRIIENERCGVVRLDSCTPAATTWRNCDIERVEIFNCRLIHPLRFEGCRFSAGMMMISNWVEVGGSIGFDAACRFPAPPVLSPRQKATEMVRHAGWRLRHRARLAWRGLRGIVEDY